VTSNAKTTDQYIDELPPDRQEPVNRLLGILKQHLPEGFTEGMGYGMPGFSVPHSTYPAGYHCDPKQPLPFIGLASQKGHIGLYHMGLYADPGLMEWFKAEYPKHSKTKLDMGKSCIRFKKPEHIPYELIGQLAEKMTPERWIAIYEEVFRKQDEAKRVKEKVA
jgi:uncharacterized protein YdhG (YjbR/CyaY superfamily)